MADEKATVVSPAEFSKIPLDFIIATPLLTAIEAHKVAAQTTLDFVRNLLPDSTTDKSSDEKSVKFKMLVKEKDAKGVVGDAEKEITVPLIALVKVPSLNFDSLSVSFNYNISQVARDASNTVSKAELKASTKGVLAQFVSASLLGSVEHTRTRENTSNRGGSLEIKIHVSESPLPAGLQKIIDAVVESVDVQLLKPKS